MSIIYRRKITLLFCSCSCKRMPLHHSPSVIHNLVGGKKWFYLWTERRILIKPAHRQSSVPDLEIRKSVSFKWGFHHLCLLQIVFKMRGFKWIEKISYKYLLQYVHFVFCQWSRQDFIPHVSNMGWLK